MFTELLVVEAKLIHKVGGHLLDLIVCESLRGSTGGSGGALRVGGWIDVDKPYLLQGQVVGEGALHVVVLAGRVHVVGAHLQNTSSASHTGLCKICCTNQAIQLYYILPQKKLKFQVQSLIFFIFETACQSGSSALLCSHAGTGGGSSKTLPSKSGLKPQTFFPLELRGQV